MLDTIKNIFEAIAWEPIESLDKVLKPYELFKNEKEKLRSAKKKKIPEHQLRAAQHFVNFITILRTTQLWQCSIDEVDFAELVNVENSTNLIKNICELLNGLEQDVQLCLNCTSKNIDIVMHYASRFEVGHELQIFHSDLGNRKLCLENYNKFFIDPYVQLTLLSGNNSQEELFLVAQQNIIYYREQMSNIVLEEIGAIADISIKIGTVAGGAAALMVGTVVGTGAALGVGIPTGLGIGIPTAGAGIPVAVAVAFAAGLTAGGAAGLAAGLGVSVITTVTIAGSVIWKIKEFIRDLPGMLTKAFSQYLKSGEASSLDFIEGKKLSKFIENVDEQPRVAKIMMAAVNLIFCYVFAFNIYTSLKAKNKTLDAFDKVPISIKEFTTSFLNDLKSKMVLLSLGIELTEFFSERLLANRYLQGFADLMKLQCKHPKSTKAFMSLIGAKLSISDSTTGVDMFNHLKSQLAEHEFDLPPTGVGSSSLLIRSSSANSLPNLSQISSETKETAAFFARIKELRKQPPSEPAPPPPKFKRQRSRSLTSRKKPTAVFFPDASTLEKQQALKDIAELLTTDEAKLQRARLGRKC